MIPTAKANSTTDHDQTGEGRTLHDLGEGVAVIGMGCVLPQAPNVDAFWENVLQGKDCIIEVPKHRWDPEVFYHPDGKEARSYTKIGGFVTGFTFDSIRFRMPPKMAEALDDVQKMALVAVHEALQSAGYVDERLKPLKEIDGTRTAVILGNSMGGEVQRIVTRRIGWPLVEQTLRQTPEIQALEPAVQNALVQHVHDAYLEGVPEVTEDTMPGELANIVAGRIANVFHFQGKNHTVDAACASSFAALDAAMKGLLEREFDVVVTGGADRSMDIDTYSKFCAIGALSPRGSSPFDARADGFVMGEGAAVFVLKRLSDAVRDGDHIHAVLRGVGASSDGRGKGITAPNQQGQVFAIERAIERAQIQPDTLQYIEAHGTSTRVGDVVEVEALSSALRAAGFPPGSVGLGSVKSQIGHLKSAAGAAGLLKTILALEHGTLPPSIHFETPNPKIDWATSPFRVITQPESWPQHASGAPRRAGVSSFGFGGTNFHVVLEAYVPEIHTREAQAVESGQTTGPHGLRPIGDRALLLAPASPPATLASPVAPVAPGHGSTTWDEVAARLRPLEAEPLILGADSQEALLAEIQRIASTFPEDEAFLETGDGARLKDRVYALNVQGVKAAYRAGLVCKDGAHAREQAKFAIAAASDPNKARLAPIKGVFYGSGQPRGKVAFLFPGQGSQYAEMLVDLYHKYAIVRDTFVEADAIMEPLLGHKLTPIIFPQYAHDDEEARLQALREAEEALRQTEICQPAVLTADLAIWRLLRSMGIEADVVAGHSLGEYAALVAAGILRFEDALLAVSARGKEMANVDVPDLGKMASITAPFEQVEQVLSSCTNYVIPANKNCPAMTVIAGSSAGVDEAVSRFAEQGIQAIPIPVSAAFHSDIVAPASQPLRKVLERLAIHPPTVPIYANVTGHLYENPTDADANREYVLDMLAQQVASPVEWTRIIENMYAAGVTTFIEVGPKRALTGFTQNILEGREHIPVATNHPKKGGIYHINEAIALLAAMGRKPKVKHPQAQAHYTHEFLHPTTTVGERESQSRNESVSVSASPTAGPLADEGPLMASDELRESGWDTSAEIVISGASVGLPGRQSALFDDSNIDRILAGENRIDPLTVEERKAILDKNIVRLTKTGAGAAGFETIQDTAQVIQLAAKIGRFDLHQEFGIDADMADTFDITTKMAIGAGIDALRDAGIPLVRNYRQTSTGSYLPGDWTLPNALQDDTGVIFASAFPGYDNLLDEVSRHMAARFSTESQRGIEALFHKLTSTVHDATVRNELERWVRTEMPTEMGVDTNADYVFNRKFLFNVLSMGHAQFAQLIKARGPNVQLNAACSSTTLAIATAEDWIRAGRCKRVLIIGADNVTSDRMNEWIGAGFLASGAATTEADVTQAALPFDRRRHGMIIGAGAVGLVVERRDVVQERGMDGIVRLLATRIANSAFHGSRLDVAHIREQFRKVVEDAARATNMEPEAMAAEMLFMSHETYTPARGGSASAEVEGLRASFGPHTNRVIIANTKGFTGHPMGAGIEDAIAVKALQLGRVPPVANLSETDPEFQDLNLSRGGTFDGRFALRLAAGFGSQIALWVGERLTKGTSRIANDERHQAWLAAIAGTPEARTEIVQRTLRVVDIGPPERKASPARPAQTTLIAAGATKTADEATQRIAGKATSSDSVPPSQEPRPGIPAASQPPSSGAVSSGASAPALPSASPGSSATPASAAEGAASPTLSGTESRTMGDAAQAAGVGRLDRSEVLEAITDQIATQTGYPVEMLEPDLDMEADLGIDTVKQAELFGIVREAYGLPLDEGLQIKDYPTIARVADYVMEHHAAARAGNARASSEAAPGEDTPASSAGPETVVLQGPEATAQAHEAHAPLAVDAPTSASGVRPTEKDVLDAIIKLVADKTGYPADMLEPELDMEADLGIDTVKQAEIFGELRERFAVPLDDGLQIKDYPTMAAVARYMHGRQSMRAEPTNETSPALAAGSAQSTTTSSEATQPTSEPPKFDHPAAQPTGGDPAAIPTPSVAASMPASAPAAAPAPSTATHEAPPSALAGGITTDEALARITQLVADKTGYPADMLEPGLDMEADLGIDTVKQAELFGEIRNAYGIPLDENLQIKDYPTIQAVAGYVVANSTQSSAPAPSTPPHAMAPVQEASPASRPATTAARAADLNPKPGAAPVGRAPPNPSVRPDALRDHKQPQARDLLSLDDGAPTHGASGTHASNGHAIKQGVSQSHRAVEPAAPASPGLRTLDDGAPSHEAGPETGHAAATAGIATHDASPRAPGPARVAPQSPPKSPTPATTPPARADQPPPPPPPDLDARMASKEDVLARVTTLVADKTGYPRDMLEPGLDMEADLGIDTVKQAELFGDIRQAYGLDLPEGLQIADYPTIGHVAEFVLERQVAASAPLPTTEAQSEAPSSTLIKQPPQVQPVAREVVETEGDPKPQAETRATPSRAIRPEPAARARSDDDRAGAVGALRRVPIPVEAPLSAAGQGPVSVPGPLVILQDRLGWSDEIARALVDANLAVVLVGPQKPPEDVPVTYVPCDLAVGPQIERAMQLILQRLGPVGGLIHMASLDERRLPADVRAFRDVTASQVKSLYVAARALHASIAATPGFRFVTLTRMGGTFTFPDVDGTLRTDVHFNPLDGGAAGLTKALGKEFPDAFARVVDLAQTIGPHDAGRLLVNELRHPEGHPEVGYPETHRRITIAVRARPLTQLKTHSFDAQDHVVVTGGAQGVTAEVVTAWLESMRPQERPRVTLLGRTRLPSDIAQIAAQDADELKARKDALLASLRAQHERVTPVMLNQEWSKTEKAVEVHRNLQRVRNLQPDAAYEPIDVMDQVALKKAIQSAVEARGPVTVMIHGAGLERSKALNDKDPEQFDLVFDTKVVGMHNLIVATVHQPVRTVVVMGSVAGRFGNLGQVDYSAANDLAVRYAVALARTRNGRAIGFDWSAWGEVGMATRGGIMQVMDAAGVTSISLAEGRAAFVREMHHGDDHPEIVIGGRLGQIDAFQQVDDAPLDPRLPPLVQPARTKLAVPQRLVVCEANRFAISEATLALDHLPHLDDHRVDGVPFLPGVIGVEGMAETAASLLSDDEREAGFQFRGATEVHFALPVKLLRDRPLDVRFVAERIPDTKDPAMRPDRKPAHRHEDPEADAELILREQAESDTGPAVARFVCRLESDFRGPNGQRLGDTRTHFKAVVQFGPASVDEPRVTLPEAATKGRSLVSRDQVYAHFFHGPTFQVLDGIVALDDRHIVALARFEEVGLIADQPHPNLLTAPMLREAAFQAAGFWAMAKRQRMSLPASIQHVHHFGMRGEAPPGTTFVIVARHDHDHEDGIHASYTVEAYTPEGYLIDRMEDYRMVTIGKHEASISLPPDTSGVDRDAATATSGATQGARGGGHVPRRDGQASQPTGHPDGDVDNEGVPAIDPQPPKGGKRPTESSDDGDWALFSRDQADADEREGAAQLVVATGAWAPVTAHEVVRAGMNVWLLSLDELARAWDVAHLDFGATSASDVLSTTAMPGFADEEWARILASKTLKRALDQAAGILAAKHAVVAAVERQSDARRSVTDVEPRQLVIRKTESGRPVAAWPGDGDRTSPARARLAEWIPGLALSISHAGSWACAVAAPPGRASSIGIDVEPLAAQIRQGLQSMFTEGERRLIASSGALLDGDQAAGQTIVWTIKEAVLKAIDTGLSIPLAAVEVQAVHPQGTASVKLGPEALAAPALRGSNALEVRWCTSDDGYAYATCAIGPR